MQIAAWILITFILLSSGGLFYAALKPLRGTSSARFLLLFAGIQLALAGVLISVTLTRAG